MYSSGGGFLFVCLGWGLPILVPLALAVCSPALVCSDMSVRSYSANAEEIWQNILPRAVVVSIPSLRDRKCMPRFSRFSSVPTRPLRDLPSRSILTTTRVSPRPRSRLRAFPLSALHVRARGLFGRSDHAPRFLGLVAGW